MGKVFISYSHDSRDHLDRVLALSNRLRSEGVDCHIDQYQDSPPEGWPTWCANQVEEAEFVLVVCTATYELRFRGKEQLGKGLGVTWEGFVITQQLYEAQGSNAKFIPVLLASEDSAHIPLTLRGATRYDISNADGYDALYRRVTHQPLVIMPELGEIRQRSQRVVKHALATLPRKQTFHETSVGTYAAIALIAVIFAFGFTIFYIYKVHELAKNVTQATFDLTVRAHNADGSVPIIAAGTVTMDLDNDRRTEPFRENGEADFKGVPSKFFGNEIKVLAHVEGYEEKWEVHKITSGFTNTPRTGRPM
jgi:hypothetical protein